MRNYVEGINKVVKSDIRSLVVIVRFRYTAHNGLHVGNIRHDRKENYAREGIRHCLRAF